MISLNTFILEALQRVDIEKNLKFVKISDERFKDLFDTIMDNGKNLGLEKDETPDDLALLNISDKFEIRYENKLLGIITYLLPDKLYKIVKKEIDDLQGRYTINYTLREFTKFHYDNLVHKDEKIFEDPKKDEDEISYSTRILKETAYVCCWELFKEPKKQLDINEISLIKVFFEKLKSELKTKGKVKYFFAHGKDDRVGNLYIKLCNGVSSLKTIKANPVNKRDRDNSNAFLIDFHKTAVFAKI
jgi:hypothetical protein